MGFRAGVKPEVKVRHGGGRGLRRRWASGWLGWSLAVTTGLEGRCSKVPLLEGDLVDDAEADERGEREGDADGEEVHVDRQLVSGVGYVWRCHDSPYWC